ncbi:MAG: ATPase [Muribaculaceae bacterium]|nr:ATPase [Muribaculaceae bacterium]
MSDRLVADCGSTKCAWALLRADGSGERFVSAGMNPAVLDRAVLESLLREGLSGLGRPGDVGEVWFYGAGCAGEGAERMRSALARLLPGADVEVSSDLLGAARALFGDAAGVACILGTGSNSGYYDGREIVRNVRPMGFIIGDEGSGASIGRTVLNQYYKGWLDESTRRDFEREFPALTYDEVIRRVYREPGGNRFLASFAPFAAAHMADRRLAERVDEGFAAFFRESLAAYPADLPVGFAGSLASAFEPRLRGLLGGRRATFAPSPLEALAAYHAGFARE